MPEGGEDSTATPKSEAAQLRAGLRRLRGLTRVLPAFLYSVTPGMRPDCGAGVRLSGAVRGTSPGPKAAAALHSRKSGKGSAIGAGRPTHNNYMQKCHMQVVDNAPTFWRMKWW